MLLRLEDCEIDGLRSIDGYLDVSGPTDLQVAHKIRERLATLDRLDSPGKDHAT